MSPGASCARVASRNGATGVASRTAWAPTAKSETGRATRGEERDRSRDAGGPRRLPVAGPDGPPGRRTDDRDLVGQAIARAEASADAAHLVVAGRLQIGGLQTERERRRLRESSQESDPEDHGVALPRAPGLRSD